MSREFYHEPLILLYSGGKDSEVLLALAESVLDVNDFMVVNSHTTVDAPCTVKIIRDTFKRLEAKGIKTKIEYKHYKDGSPITMWNLIVKKKMPPSFKSRYCCQVLKESSAPNRLIAVGVREDESNSRKGRDTFNTSDSNKNKRLHFSLEHAEEVFRESLEINDPNWDCTLISNMKKNKKIILNPIYEWTTSEVWDYIHENNLVINPLYDMGYKRVGCVGCPLGTFKNRAREFKDFPKYKQMYINAFQKMVDECGYAENNPKWKDGQAVFDWWMQTNVNEIKGQMKLFEE